jgi:hypothetical protein
LLAPGHRLAQIRADPPTCAPAAVWLRTYGQRVTGAPPRIDRAVANALWRRPPGDRVLVYLDHSTLSELARDEKPEFGELRRLLERAVESGRLICPYSPQHRDEAVLARPDTYDLIDKLGDVPAMGIEFLDRELMEWHEIYAAARAFLREEPRPLWKEAFREDPHTPREELFSEFMGGQIRVKARFAADEEQRAEVGYQKAKEDPMFQAYAELRGAGVLLRADGRGQYRGDAQLEARAAGRRRRVPCGG